MSLSDEVRNFKLWAETCPLATRSGEWECDYDGWEQLHSAALEFLDSTSPEHWFATEVDDLLCVIARDNEIEYLAKHVAKSNEMLLQLASLSVQSSESDAKWQLAYQLGQMDTQKTEAEAILLKLVEDKNEYVSRRALLALGEMKSAKAEMLAERAWDSGQEYQRIAALWVLKNVSSTKLDAYIVSALEDGREHLVHNAFQVKRPSDYAP